MKKQCRKSEKKWLVGWSKRTSRLLLELKCDAAQEENKYSQTEVRESIRKPVAWLNSRVTLVNKHTSVFEASKNARRRRCVFCLIFPQECLLILARSWKLFAQVFLNLLEFQTTQIELRYPWRSENRNISQFTRNEPKVKSKIRVLSRDRHLVTKEKLENSQIFDRVRILEPG